MTAVLRFLKVQLKQLDLFGVPIHLQIKRSSSHTTLFGSFLSIWIMVFITYSFTSLVLDMIGR